MQITAQQIDITTLAVDAIVNATNNYLGDGLGVNGAIQRAAGPELLRYCAELGGCETGQAKITPGFNLPAKYIIHTVGPVWNGGDYNEAALLASCYKSCLELADQTPTIKIISFPAISTGVFGYPPAEATEIAVNSVRKYGNNLDIEQVIFACFDQKMLELYQQLL